ncbi:selenocysteine lyase/cysteine desulfurase [Actinocorallia herbida]|uniref:Selenocysteine lyase/cysteine desulfurase n=1 Tax=Actinocorallia herbida TaxID=58109 RepID=A0A3N1CNL0_9ACTN|nr:aminotransferase class V-fold PLP-dependent enzyme [Actinocorallia herbida]ROO82917.1 selenocysteine lyase/cysteine desulfurase [Actinocorallia herbida]
MRSEAQEEFFLAPGLTLLNHASYGLTSRRVAAHADRIRQEIESDPTVYLGQHLTERLRELTAEVATALTLPATGTTLCANATSAAAAIVSSLPLGSDSTVIVLDTEYSSILRAWEQRCRQVGADLIRIPVRIPFTGPHQLLADLDELVPGTVSYLQFSLISSSTAIRFPIEPLLAWARARGGRTVLDAAHGPGHVPLAPGLSNVDAMFGTLHKWFPSLRPVGFLWLSEDLIDVVRPAEVSLTWDSADLVGRFSWPGTFDPVPRLSLDEALTQHCGWLTAGAFTRCEDLSAASVPLLADLGAIPTTTDAYAPPRMRAFTLDGVTVSEVKASMSRAGIRVWCGPGADGSTILRIATHVYTDQADLELLCAQLKETLP